MSSRRAPGFFSLTLAGFEARPTMRHPGPETSVMFDHAYMRDAFLAGGPIALAAGLVGYFLVLRAQSFTADALSRVAVTGALAALVIGIDLRVGLFAAGIGAAVLMGTLGRGG